MSEMKPSDRMFMRCQFVFGSDELTGAERETLGLFGAQLRDPFALFGSVQWCCDEVLWMPFQSSDLDLAP